MERESASLLLDITEFLIGSWLLTKAVRVLKGTATRRGDKELSDDRSYLALNPIEQTKRTCQDVVSGAKSVFIDVDAIEKVAEELAQTDIDNFVNGVRWDENDWHYCEDAKIGGPKTCQYIFVLDCLNFCFWQTKDLEYDYLATALKKVYMNCEKNFDAKNLAEMTEDTLQSWFPDFKLPLLSERVNRLRELGNVLSNHYRGLACNVVFSANHCAPTLVQILIEKIPGFRDAYVNPSTGQYIHFYKRAQILVGDLWAAYERPSRGHKYYLANMSDLTTFADYRVPQILRSMGVLRYAAELARDIDNHQMIPCGSIPEIEIRASTVVAVEMLHKVLVSKGHSLLAIELDWLLWQKGESTKEKMKPHHRTLTIFY